MRSPASDDVLRLAVWSGPRNISTALMRSFGQRRDTIVCDEPLYAHYLRVTRLPHPGAEEVIASHEGDWRQVADWLTGPLPAGRRVFYQKHMAHHLLPNIGREWLDGLTHVFLIRDPRAMLASLAKHLDEPTLADTGLPQQWEIYQRESDRIDRAPPVIDARDVLANPRAALTALCRAVDLQFDEAMLAWPPGLRETDGVWAKHWYQEVETSTGFRPFTQRPVDLPPSLEPLAAQCAEYYNRLAPHKLATGD